MRLEKKVPQTYPKIQGGGVKAVQQKSKVKLLFFLVASLTVSKVVSRVIVIVGQGGNSIV